MIWVGRFTTAFFCGLTLLAFFGLLDFSFTQQQNFASAFQEIVSDPFVASVLRFSLTQAVLSSLISVALAIPLARALYFSQTLPGRSIFLSLCTLCFVMPTLILITGMIALLGRSGLLTPSLQFLLQEKWNLYGLTGILLAHVYLNLPFAIRLLFLQYQNIPDTSWRLARQLKCSPWQQIKLIEWPSIRHSIFICLGFIAVMCFNSFAVVLALGGGPKSTTLEVAIYQALKYDFDIPMALILSWIQLIIAGAAFVVVTRLGNPSWINIQQQNQRFLPQPGQFYKLFYKTVYGMAWLFLVMPILALIPGLVPAMFKVTFWISLLKPTLVSLTLAISVAALSTGLAYLMLYPSRAKALKNKSSHAYDWLTTHGLIAPAMVVSVGSFVFWLRRVDLDSIGFVYLWLLNILITLPFAISQLKPQLLLFDAQYHKLVSNLKLSPMEKLKIELGFAKPALLLAASLVMVLALGDVAIFSIFGNQQWTTLPWLIYSYAGSYRIAEASLASVILLALAVSMIYLFERSQKHA